MTRAAPTRAAGGPIVEPERVTFRLEDPHRSWSRVVLHQELVRPRNGPPFTYEERTGTWTLVFERMAVDRMEYKLELTSRDGRGELICDPANPETAPGPFGERSVIEFPGYRAPAWTTGTDAGSVTGFGARCRPLGARLPVELWTPPDTDPEEPLPLLVAHDGPEYRELSQLGIYLSQMLGHGRIPRARAALVGPVERDSIYSASAAYGRSFAHDVLPQITRRAPTPHGRTNRIGMGASLGALSMLHIHRRSPASFGALFLQSGSYFRQRSDKQESGFPKFRRISRFVGEVLTAEEWAHPVPATMTCGGVEENIHNNRAIAEALGRQGYDVSLVENRDAHNWIAWRDCFDPHLTQLLSRVWG